MSHRNWARHGLRELADTAHRKGRITEEMRRTVWLWTILHSGPRAAESLSSTLHLCHGFDEGFGNTNANGLTRILQNENSRTWPECDGTHMLSFIKDKEFCPICATLEDVVVQFYEYIDWVDEHSVVLLESTRVDDWIEAVNYWLSDNEHPAIGLIELLVEQTDDGDVSIKFEIDEPLNLNDIMEDRYDC